MFTILAFVRPSFTVIILYSLGSDYPHASRFLGKKHRVLLPSIAHPPHSQPNQHPPRSSVRATSISSMSSRWAARTSLNAVAELEEQERAEGHECRLTSCAAPILVERGIRVHRRRRRNLPPPSGQRHQLQVQRQVQLAVISEPALLSLMSTILSRPCRKVSCSLGRILSSTPSFEICINIR